MYSFLSRYGQLIALGIGVFITLVFFIIIGANNSYIESLADMKRLEYNAALSQTSIFDFGLYGTFALIILTTLAVLAFGVLGIVTDIKGSMKSLIGFGALILIFVISYFVAGSMGDSDSVLAVIEKMATRGQIITPGISNFISASLITTLILGGITTLGAIVSAIWNLFR